MTGSGPDAVRPKEWAITTTGGETVRGYLPDWAQDDPSRSGVRPDRLHIALSDIVLENSVGGLSLPVAHGQAPAQDTPVLVVAIGCKPFGEDDEPHAPVACVQIIEDFWINNLGPDAVADLGQRLQTLGDLLVTTVKPSLEERRADWERHCSGARTQD